MGLLPDINEEGEVVDSNPVPKLYTPRELHPMRREGWEIRHDTHGTHRKDAPTMSNIHECVPDESGQCITCKREMIV